MKPAADASAGGAVVEAAPAKVNLYLHVTGRRADGYHLLDSLIAFAGLHDTVVAAPAERLSLARAGPFAGDLPAAAGDDLVLRAARALAGALGHEPKVALTLVKRIPVAAGLGGGSADAAATLRALCRLWDLRPSRAALARLALSVGADVVACLGGRAVSVAGVGERLAPAPRLPAGCHLVLANPGLPLATRAVFAARREPFSPANPVTAALPDAAALAAALAARRNDLEPAAAALAPAVGEVLAALSGLPGSLFARLSGSGATGFALFAGAEAARAGARVLAAAHPAWWVAATPMVTDIAAVRPEPAPAARTHA